MELKFSLLTNAGTYVFICIYINYCKTFTRRIAILFNLIIDRGLPCPFAYCNKFPLIMRKYC